MFIQLHTIAQYTQCFKCISGQLQSILRTLLIAYRYIASRTSTDDTKVLMLKWSYIKMSRNCLYISQLCSFLEACNNHNSITYITYLEYVIFKSQRMILSTIWSSWENVQIVSRRAIKFNPSPCCLIQAAKSSVMQHQACGLFLKA